MDFADLLTDDPFRFSYNSKASKRSTATESVHKKQLIRKKSRREQEKEKLMNPE